MVLKPWTHWLVRTIKKRQAPKALVQWRQQRIAANDPVAYPFDYDGLRQSGNVLFAVEQGLFEEQGGICAYTGRRIHLEAGPPQRAVFHLEHLKGQTRCRAEAAKGLCEAGFDAHYNNLVACWPEPNQKQGTSYGAILKDDWPKNAGEDGEFLSPLRADCTKRFKFDRLGEIEAAKQQDAAAEKTITKLGLGHDELIALRKEAIRGGLNPLNRPLKLHEAEKLRTVMDKDEAALNGGANVQLRPFCFALRPMLDKEISKLKGIQKSLKKKQK